MKKECVMTRVFISSVQKEFAAERKALCKYIREDVLLCKFFEPFLFEELPATNMSAQEAYLKEAAESEVYLGIYGKEYGYEDSRVYLLQKGNMIPQRTTAVTALYSSSVPSRDRQKRPLSSKRLSPKSCEKHSMTMKS